MNVPSGTIVIPCYNEEKRFPLDRFTAFVDANPSIHFLLVNDGSKDRTTDVLQRARAGREHQVDVLDQPVNGGKGEAVRAGILRALQREGCFYVGFWDADMATPLAQIAELAAVLAARPQLAMVFGARVKLLGRNVERRAVRHYLGRIFATVVSTVLRLPIYDTQCGAKLFRVTSDTAGLFAEPFSSRWVFDVEIIARFIRQRRYDMAAVEQAIYEFPLPEWRDVAGSQVRPGDFLRAFFDVLRIYRQYRP
ncbi:MAG: glycosyltransferase [Bryobacterales bacterium]|nr:glycosyltransferase [Bryobacterales bacterium]